MSDRSALRLGLLMAGLVVALVAGFGLGRMVEAPVSPDAASLGESGAGHPHPPGTGPHEHGAGGGAATAAAGVEVSGLSLSAGGYTLTPTAGPVVAGRRAELRFQVRDADRRPVTTFAVVHEKPMHLIVARRDLSGFQHLHPTMAPDGTWRTPLTLPEPGVWRAYADFTALDAAGRQTAATLGVDLAVPGDYRPRTLPVDARAASVDGFDVTYEGTPQVGAVQPLLFWVFRGGAPATVEPYLGAQGHLVALREGDLGYVHVHPEAAPAGGAVKFWVAAPSPGRYRLFLDFQVAGQVHTAEFTLTVP